jgi:hypothetical protein
MWQLKCVLFRTIIARKACESAGETRVSRQEAFTSGWKMDWFGLPRPSDLRFRHPLFPAIL